MSENYPLKYINFVKETNKFDLNKAISGKEIREFYENLTSQDTIQSNNDENDDIIEIESDLNESQIEHEILIDVNLLNKNEYFKAVQNSDFKTVKSYLSRGFDVNTIDSFNWSGLMIAVGESNTEIVKLLLDFNAKYSITDKAGNDVFKIARRKNNEEIYEILLNHSSKIKDESCNEIIVNEESTEIQEYCEKCDKIFSSKEKSSHLTSIIHIINENEKDPNAKLSCMNYHVKNNDKGYQLLMKEGWNQLTGLGSNEQGRKFPIKAVAKYDRLGIGIENEMKQNKYANNLNILRLKRNDPKQIKSLKDIKKDTKKMKIIERNFRAYLNS
jgi:ankyrin repeat protein